jgi:hypothetical protein
MPRTDDSLNLSEIARLAGVNRGTPQKWHRLPPGQEDADALPPLRAVAQAMGVEVPDVDAARPRYPRKVVEAFLKAVGYMDDSGALVEAIKTKSMGRWLPVEPTVDPRPGHRRRYYVPHVAKELGREVPSFEQSRSRGRFPEPDGYDELFRPFWFSETIEKYKQRLQDRKERVGAGPEPDGYTEDGQPYRLLPADSYYARKKSQDSGADLQE